MALVDRMVEKECEPDVVTYGAVVNGVCKRGNVDLALVLLKNMDKGKIKVGVVIYTTVIDGLCKNMWMMLSTCSMKWRTEGLAQTFSPTTPS